MGNEILFLLPVGNKSGLFDPKIVDGGASIRLQLLPAAKACTALGFSNTFLSLTTKNPEDLCLIQNPKACITGKLRIGGGQIASKNVATAHLAAMARIKSQGSKLVVTYSDHVEDHGCEKSIQNLYKDALMLADAIVYPCESIRQKARKWIDYEAIDFVIEDPWQTKEHPFESNPSRIIKIAWFGHNTNVKYLLQILHQIESTIPEGREAIMSILSSKQACAKIKNFLNTHPPKRNLKFNITIWDDAKQPHQLEQFLSEARFCIIPSDHKDPRKSGASHNRLVDSIHSGCITVASPLESYLELKESALISEDIISSLKEAILKQKELSAQFRSSRDKHINRFCPSTNLKKWKECLNHVTNM